MKRSFTIKMLFLLLDACLRKSQTGVTLPVPLIVCQTLDLNYFLLRPL